MKKQLPLITFIIGLATLVAGGVFLIINLFFSQPQTADAEYIVQIGAWSEEGTNGSVIWNFSEIGKGTLTTNAHINDYNFIWSLENETLKVETAWLYDLNNEYTYILDQSESKLTLTDSNSKTYIFVPAAPDTTTEMKTVE